MPDKAGKTITTPALRFVGSTLRIVTLPPQQIAGPRDFTWQAPTDCELVDVRLIQVEGDVDVALVFVANVIQVAFQRKPHLVRCNELVRVQVEKTGTFGGQCAVEIVYRPLFQDRVEP